MNILLRISPCFEKLPFFIKGFDGFLSYYSKNIEDFYFIQVGANDGVTIDPIHRCIIDFKWQGILIEPVEYLFDKLVDNYKGKNNLIFENVAISDQKGQKLFYRIEKNNEKGSPNWYDQLGSFLPDVVFKYKGIITNFEKHFISEKVECVTLNSIIKKHKVKKIDLVVIDVQGYDYEIIKTIDFREIKPRMILYEHGLLSYEDQKECEKLLRDKGYSIKVFSRDTFACLK